MATVVEKLADRLLNHTEIYKFTAQMCQDVYMTIIHAVRDINRACGSFEQLKEQGPAAYIVVFQDEYQEIGKKLFNYLRQTLEAEVKRNDAGITLLVGKEESDKINNGGISSSSEELQQRVPTNYNNKLTLGKPTSKKRKLTTSSSFIPEFPDLTKV